jgi:hypothetical protein
MGVTGKASLKISKISLNRKGFELNDHMIFHFKLKSTSKRDQKIIVDYAIDFQKANGKKGLKVFKLKTFTLKTQEEVLIEKKHSLKPITTMKYYKGTHHLYVQVNGEILEEVSWKLKA